MRIAKIEDLHADGGWRTTSFLKLTTDEGLVGWAEYYEGFGAGGVSDLIRRFAAVVEGMDPRDVGRISTSLHAICRMAAGGMNHQAIAAIENACLDVKAKALGVPVYALFGGAMRDRLDLYWSHCGSFRVWQRDFFEKELGLPPVRTLDDIKELGREAARRGYKALKTNPLQIGDDARPFNPGFRIGPGFLDRSTDARWHGQIGDVVGAFREGAGPNMGIMLDLNFSQRTDGFLRIAQTMERFKLAWLEVDIHDADALALLRRSTRTPIASLESLYGLKQYRPFLQQHAVDVAVVDVPWNGLWESIRVATLADAFEVDVAPHNYYGDLATLMSAHFCAAVPNFRIMEYEADDVPWRGDFVTHPPVVANGQLTVPTRPGWGADVNEEAVRARPPRRKA
jgi:L-alanine-DL-glutamate epimerase-like enolase superfamily enzyme